MSEHDLHMRIRELEAENDQLRVQLAGCGAEALGYGQGVKPGDYGWSESLGDVRKLRERFSVIKLDKVHGSIGHINHLSTRLCRNCQLDGDNIRKELEHIKKAIK